MARQRKSCLASARRSSRSFVFFFVPRNTFCCPFAAVLVVYSSSLHINLHGVITSYLGRYALPARALSFSQDHSFLAGSDDCVGSFLGST